ncbi:MAG: aminotransferase class IV [Pseudomonadota bacterium]
MEGALRGSQQPNLRVIETLGWRPHLGAVRREDHLARAEKTCADLLVPFDRSEARDALQKISGDYALRVRMSWGADGLVVETSPLSPTPEIWRCAPYSERLVSTDPWLQVKTTNRKLYDEARAARPQGVDEWLFLNESGHLCEGAITNIFVEDGGVLLTPPLSDGLLPGVLRADLLRSGRAREAHLTLSKFARAKRAYVGNSLRGLILARLI